MRHLWYVGLEPYEARYTLQLTDWTERVLKRRKIPYTVVPGETLDTAGQIVTGQVLDAHGRSYYALSQMMCLVKAHQEGKISSSDWILFEDMFHPGIEALGYIFNQCDTSYLPEVYVRCLAQTIDPDDFVHTTGMTPWMRRYEQMVTNIPGVSTLATNEEMVAHLKIAGLTSAPIYNISGLSFGKDEVLERAGRGGAQLWPFVRRPYRVTFAARLDREKQPHFFLDLVEAHYTANPNSGWIFCIAQGGKLRSNDPSVLERIKELRAKGFLTVYENLSKEEYYSVLTRSRVLFNCALQDWVSNTVSEADALGCNVLFPAYRSFPETFANDADRMYVPWSQQDAMAKLARLMEAPHPNMGKISDWTDDTIDRMLDIIIGYDRKGIWNRERYRWDRSRDNYRDHVAEAKYPLVGG
jgi:hypothetical protein